MYTDKNKFFGGAENRKKKLELKIYKKNIKD